MTAWALVWSLSLVPLAHAWLLAQVRVGDRAVAKLEVRARRARGGLPLRGRLGPALDAPC